MGRRAGAVWRWPARGAAAPAARRRLPHLQMVPSRMVAPGGKKFGDAATCGTSPARYTFVVMLSLSAPKNVSSNRNVSKQMPNDSVMPPKPMPLPSPAAAAAPAVCHATHKPSAAAGDEPSAMEKVKPAANPPPAVRDPSHTFCACQSWPTLLSCAAVKTPDDSAEPTGVQDAPSGSARCADAPAAHADNSSSSARWGARTRRLRRQPTLEAVIRTVSPV